jgi:chromosome segregation ATPase
MTIFGPLAPDGHMERRNPPYVHPLDNAMSAAQWERLQAFLVNASKVLDEIAGLREENADLKSQIAAALNENANLKTALSGREAAHAALIKAAADLEQENAAHKEANEKLRLQLLDVEAERDEAAKNAIALVASADRKDQEITVVRAQLREARARANEAEKARDDAEAEKHKASSAKSNKDKSGGAH